MQFFTFSMQFFTFSVFLTCMKNRKVQNRLESHGVDYQAAAAAASVFAESINNEFKDKVNFLK